MELFSDQIIPVAGENKETDHDHAAMNPLARRLRPAATLRRVSTYTNPSM